VAVTERVLLSYKHQDADVRLLALEQVARDPDPDSLAFLIEGLADRSRKVRTRARALLRSATGYDLGGDKGAWREWWATYASRRCQRCRRHLYDSRLYYRAKVDLLSEPREIFLTEEDLAKDHQAEIERLAAELRNRPASEVEDEVWVRLEYFLCARCKKEYVGEVRDGPQG
jgi:HEAT repeat protein